MSNVNITIKDIVVIQKNIKKRSCNGMPDLSAVQQREVVLGVDVFLRYLKQNVFIRLFIRLNAFFIVFKSRLSLYYR